jgi:hypothetical protein
MRGDLLEYKLPQPLQGRTEKEFRFLLKGWRGFSPAQKAEKRSIESKGRVKDEYIGRSPGSRSTAIRYE